MDEVHWPSGVFKVRLLHIFPSSEVSQHGLCIPRYPCVSQLVLELSWRSGFCLPPWAAVYLGLWRSWARAHHAQRSPLLPVWYLSIQMAPHQEGQTCVWTHWWKFVYFSTRYTWMHVNVKHRFSPAVHRLPGWERYHVHHLHWQFSVFPSLGSKSQKHVLRPESLEGTDEEDPVSALEWDPLSTDYLLG